MKLLLTLTLGIASCCLTACVDSRGNLYVGPPTGTREDFKKACEARHLTCDLTAFSTGNWLASAYKPNSDESWYGYGPSAEMAIGETIESLDKPGHITGKIHTEDISTGGPQ